MGFSIRKLIQIQIKIMKEKHFCRCCLSEECYKDMANNYYIGKETENYFEMLKNIFKINICTNDDQRCFICEDCVSKLRDASAFKKKVLEAQEIIKKDLCRINNGTDVDTTIVPKIQDAELDDFHDDISDKDFNWENFTECSSQNEQLFFLIISESKQDEIQKNNQTISQFDINQSYKIENEEDDIISSSKLSQKRRYRPKSTDLGLKGNKRVKISSILDQQLKDSAPNLNNPDSEDDSDNIYTDTFNSETEDCIIAKKSKTNSETKDCIIAKKSKSNKKTSTERSVKNKAASDHKEKVKRIKTKQEYTSQTESHLKYKRENTLKLIQNSNLCIFRSFQNKYGCYFCQTKFNEISQLREHLQTHPNPKILAQINRLRGLSCKNAEISDLKCNICSENCTDLQQLTDHLKNKHEFSFHGTEHYLVPYKLQNGFQCVLCKIKFNTYLRLSIHMNTHYTNNICDKCGLSFINRQGLLSHEHAQHKEKKCSHCPAIFLTSASKTKHLRQVHNIRNSKRYCNLCNKTFLYSYMVNEHKIKEHGYTRQLINCTQCDKTFLSAINLKIHVRSVHIKERNYPCTNCGMRFFTKCDQVRHERTHEDVRSFCCHYCESKFKSKDSWRRHLKRQHGHSFGKNA